MHGPCLPIPECTLRLISNENRHEGAHQTPGETFYEGLEW